MGGEMRNWLPVLLATSFVAACATTEDVLMKPADETYHSPQSQAEVARCFKEDAGALVTRHYDGAMIARYRNGYGGVIKTFSIYDEGTGSRIEVRTEAFGIYGPWKRCVGLAND
jgi:hypothetical protein